MNPSVAITIDVNFTWHLDVPGVSKKARVEINDRIAGDLAGIQIRTFDQISTAITAHMQKELEAI